MNPQTRGVALIVKNPRGEILVLRELESKPYLGKMAGMFGIPMETLKEDEDHKSALGRLVEEELPGFGGRIHIETECVGVYHINKAQAFLYHGSVPDFLLPAPQVSGGEVGDHKWLLPEDVLSLWLRQGAREMISDYISGAVGVVRVCARI